MVQNRLSKTLAHAGVASRRAAEQLITDGKVRVNGKIVLVPQTLVEPGRDQIFVDNKKIITHQKRVYYALNKPAGYLCSSKAHLNQRIVLDLFNTEHIRLFTVGRLDKDTTGLILVTNDGHFAHRVIHPSSNVVKEYLVKTDKEVSALHLKQISKGCFIEGSFVKPLRVQKIRRGTLKISVGEGKKREVRRLVERTGLGIFELKRIRIGGLHLGSLPLGAYRTLSFGEMEQIFSKP